MSDAPSDERRALRLGRINQKGLEVATRLAELKAGQNVTLADMGAPGLDIEAMTKEERIRAFLDLVNASRARLMSGDYGRCLSCDVTLGSAVLDEVPWTERCTDCARDQAPIR
ncbi:MAG: hypothetical protein QF464_16635 [Myxococcota bacterium]|nr:hypothetical protein [Myxococcota bacterium]